MDDKRPEEKMEKHLLKKGKWIGFGDWKMVERGVLIQWFLDDVGHFSWSSKAVFYEEWRVSWTENWKWIVIILHISLAYITSNIWNFYLFPPIICIDYFLFIVFHVQWFTKCFNSRRSFDWKRRDRQQQWKFKTRLCFELYREKEEEVGWKTYREWSSVFISFLSRRWLVVVWEFWKKLFSLFSTEKRKFELFTTKIEI